MTVTSLFPILGAADARRLVEFYTTGFGGEVTYRFPADDGDDGDDDYVTVALGSATLGIGRDPDVQPGTDDRISLWLYVDDVDKSYAAALDAGGAAAREPRAMPWGERVAQVRDPAGNLVNIASQLDPA